MTKIWIYTLDLNDSSFYFQWDVPVCESNMVSYKRDFIGTHYNEDYALGIL